MSHIVNESMQALKRFGKSVCIVTSVDQQGRYATPSSAITNLTNNPPTLLSADGENCFTLSFTE